MTTTTSPQSSSVSYFHPNLHGVFVGSGSDGLADPRIADTILKLLDDSKIKEKNPARPPTVLYLGTATYDIKQFQTKQTQCFIDRGCTVEALDVASTTITSLSSDDVQKIQIADVIVVSGGNTLYAVDRWTKVGLVPLLHQAMANGTIVSGGSAGAICFFDSGHSDSQDPDTYAEPMLEKYLTADTDLTTIDESSTLGETVKEWTYIRVHGLGFLPGLVCPHHDRVQSNGVLRAHDFDQMLLRHSGEIGIGIDHWAALVVAGEDYEVLSLDGKSGSVVNNDSNNPNQAIFGVDENGNANGVPGIWIKEVIDGEVRSRVCPSRGKLKDILKPPTKIVEDTDAVEFCRQANPSGYVENKQLSNVWRWMYLVTLWLILVVVVSYSIRRSLEMAEDEQHCESGSNIENVSWDPKATHPCTIERLSMTELKAKYDDKGGLPPLHPFPLVITDGMGSNRNEKFRDLTQFDTIAKSFPDDFDVTLSSSNSFSEHRSTIPFAQYLKEVVTNRTTPDQKSNETWYLFGETYSLEWKQLLRNYEIPPCQACKNDDLVALAFGIGNSGSGVQWHVHGPGFSEAVHGRKHWILYKDKPHFHPDQTSYNWMYYNYTAMETKERPLECTLYPGDMVYFPDMWWHATINLDDYTAFISTFVQEHLYVDE
jgi:dipeptidase E